MKHRERLRDFRVGAARVHVDEYVGRSIKTRLPEKVKAAWVHYFAGHALGLTAAPVVLTRSGNKIDMAIGGKPFKTYDFSETIAKPFLMALRTAAGIVISRDFPVANSVTAEDQKDGFVRTASKAALFQSR
jgi:hypothetical protein